MREALLFLFSFLFFIGETFAQSVVGLPDGRRVRLHEDFTWEYVEEEGQSAAVPEQLVLTVEGVAERGGGCALALRMANPTSEELGSIVPQFTAFKAGDIKYQTVFQAFGAIRPTLSDYEEISFSSIACADIAYLVVSGANRCTFGELTRFNALGGECLARIRVEPSPQITIRK